LVPYVKVQARIFLKQTEIPPYCFIQSSNDSQNPMRYIDTAMEFARKNINPIAPPNSGPKKDIFG